MNVLTIFTFLRSTVGQRRESEVDVVVVRKAEPNGLKAESQRRPVSRSGVFPRLPGAERRDSGHVHSHAVYAWRSLAGFAVALLSQCR